jgi:hypothetical protein
VNIEICSNAFAKEPEVEQINAELFFLRHKKGTLVCLCADYGQVTSDLDALLDPFMILGFWRYIPNCRREPANQQNPAFILFITDCKHHL